MRFLPQTEEELQVLSLAPEGTYYYKVIKSEERISNAGNDYISLVLKLRDLECKEYAVFTNLSLIKLLKHFCDVNEMVDIYKSGEISADQCMNKNGGMVVIGIDHEKPDGKGGTYKAKNIVKDYIVAPHGSLITPLTQKNDFIDNDIPF